MIVVDNEQTAHLSYHDHENGCGAGGVLGIGATDLVAGFGVTGLVAGVGVTGLVAGVGATGLVASVRVADSVSGVGSADRAGAWPMGRRPGDPKILGPVMHMLHSILLGLRRGWRGAPGSAAGTGWGSG